MQWLDMAKALLGSFCGALGFALLLHVPRRAWVTASLIGAVTYGLYLGLTWLGLAEPGAILLGVWAGSLLALRAARKLKMIGTIFLTLSIVPIVPGLGLYRTMRLLGEGQTGLGAQAGVEAMLAIACIAFGIGLGSMVDRMLHHHRRHE